MRLTAARRTMLGFERWPARRCVVTPLTAVFDVLLDALRLARGRQAESLSRGWWRTAVWPDPSGLTLVHIPQGSAVADLVRLAKRELEELTFVGYAGGLAEGLSLGDVFCATGVRRKPSGRDIPADLQPLAGPSGPLLSADGLLQHSDDVLRRAHAAGVFGVEMECAHLFGTRPDSTMHRGAVLLVSDLPLETPFHAVTSRQQEVVRARLRELASRMASVDLSHPSRSAR